MVEATASLRLEKSLVSGGGGGGGGGALKSPRGGGGGGMPKSPRGGGKSPRGEGGGGVPLFDPEVQAATVAAAPKKPLQTTALHEHAFQERFQRTSGIQSLVALQTRKDLKGLKVWCVFARDNSCAYRFFFWQGGPKYDVIWSCAAARQQAKKKIAKVVPKAEEAQQQKRESLRKERTRRSGAVPDELPPVESGSESDEDDLPPVPAHPDSDSEE